MRTRAEKRGDAYVLNGQKIWITNGSVADVVCVFAVTDPQAGSRGVSAFVVEKGTPGFTVGKLEKKMGIRGSPTVELVFNDCEVPAANRLGEEGEGFKIAMKVLDKSRPGIAAQALGIAAGALDYATNYAKERVAFGKPIGQHQGVGFMLADMKTEVEAARLLLYEAARRCDAGTPDVTLWAAMAKLKCGDVAMSVTTDAVQVLGGFGYSVDYPVERMMRDAKITQIYEGTQQIQRLVIARSLVGRAESRTCIREDRLMLGVLIVAFLACAQTPSARSVRRRRVAAAMPPRASEARCKARRDESECSRCSAKARSITSSSSFKRIARPIISSMDYAAPTR